MAEGTMLGRFGLKRLVILALAGGVAALGVDSAVGHVLQNDGDPSKLQWLPIFLAPATVVVLFVALFAPERTAGRWSLRLAGALNLLLGLGGTFFHLKALAENMNGKGYSWAHLTAALTTAPPSFAPSGFAAVGFVLLVLASPRFFFGWNSRSKVEAPAPARLATDDAA